MHIVHKLVVPLLILHIILHSLQAADKQINSVLASVNGKPVNLFDVLLETVSKEQELSRVYTSELLKKKIRQLRKNTLNKIITRMLIYEDFKKQKIPIPDNHIEKMLEQISGDISDGTIEGLQKQAEKYGLTLDDLKEKAKQRIAVDTMLNVWCGEKIFLTPADIYSWYRSNIDKFSVDTILSIQWFKLKKGVSPEKVKIKSEDFKKIAKEFGESKIYYSDNIEEKKLRIEFRKALRKIKEGDITPPIVIADGTFLIKLIKREKGYIKPFKTVKERIKRYLKRIRLEKVQRKYIEQLKKKAVIKLYI